MKSQQDPNVTGRKYNGSPYLKLKRVKNSPRQKIRQKLRAFAPLDDLLPHERQLLTAG
ncbi:hypothetical protein [Mucilaginibacter polytrichastri]|nr:hypothetical protein [Mucilaginibacter polytrichastri]SFT15378.1 hypothetical protein SAMN04487890_11311 [Mucilaginibacter polytrichastri]